MRNMIAGLALAVLIGSVGSPPAHAWNWFDYFLNVPGVCTAGNPNDPGTFTYIYSLNRNCNVPGRGSVPLYGLYKGGWADENYVAHNGWLYLLSERHPNLCGGTWGYREFEQAGGPYGLPYAKLTTPEYESWNSPSFFLHCGSSCKMDQTSIFQDGSPNEQALLGTIWDKLRDCRSGVCKPPIPMEVVMTRGHLYPHTDGCGMHYDAIEEYWFGRADITPNDGIANPRSIGFVRFVDLIYNHGTCGYDEGPATGWNAYLKNCSVAVSCPYC